MRPPAEFAQKTGCLVGRVFVPYSWAVTRPTSKGKEERDLRCLWGTADPFCAAVPRRTMLRVPLSP